MKIPAFEYVHSNKQSLTGALVNRYWNQYVHANFILENDTEYDAASQAAFEYNANQINEPISEPELDVWYLLIRTNKELFEISINEDSAFFCEYLSKFYLKSNKDERCLKRLIFTLNSYGTAKDTVTVLSQTNMDYTVLSTHYAEYELALMRTFLNASKTMTDNLDLFNYLAKYVCTPVFLEKYSKYNTDSYLTRINDLLENVPDFVNHTFITNQQRIDFIVSSLFLADKALLEDEMLVDAPLVKTAIMTIFERDYPEQFKQYTILKDLNVELTASELSAQLNFVEHTSSIELPELA